MKYEVRTVADHELPEGVDHVIVERDNGEPALLLICGTPARVWSLMRGFEDAREAPTIPSVLLRAV